MPVLYSQWTEANMAQEYYSSFMFTRLFIKRHIFVVHKIFQLLASKVHLSPSGYLYMVPDEWSVYVGCREDDKVEDNSGHFIKGT